MKKTFLSILFVTLLLINGFMAAVTTGVVGAAVYALWRIKQGREILAEISKAHNELVESISKIDQKCQEALLRLDHIKQ